MSKPQPERNTPIVSANDAKQAIESLEKIMDSLVETISEETERVRRGQLREATELEARKAELARRYAQESSRVKAAGDIIENALPQALERLGKRHDAFRALLQTNLTVLATAHAVSEGILRGVSDELARKQVPSTYGASGRVNRPGVKTSLPLALSRKL